MILEEENAGFWSSGITLHTEEPSSNITSSQGVLNVIEVGAEPKVVTVFVFPDNKKCIFISWWENFWDNYIWPK